MVYSFFPTILILEDGTTYKGWSFDSIDCSIGEVVFNTGMTGYQEIITDPSYAGQMVVFTYPELGNTGVNTEDNESLQVQAKGIIAKNICLYPSNWRYKVSLMSYLLEYKIPHIYGIDTRSLSKHLRIKGVMNGCISSKISQSNNLLQKVKKYPDMIGLDLASQVTTANPYKWNMAAHYISMYSYLNYITNKQVGNQLNIVVIDLGAKHNIFARLSEYGCNVYVLPSITTYSQILSYCPDGILLSNGPGDPSALHYVVNIVKTIIKFTNIPIFGICMGHQILSLALGAMTFKLKFGHRGLNHPSGFNMRAEITSQNHGFAVKAKSLSEHLCSITHLNLNDNTVAGLVHRYKPIFSVQYHPEASPGPHDSEYLFSHFIKIMKAIKLQNI